GNVHTPLVHEIATMVMQLLQHVIFFGDRLQFDHRHIAALGEIALLVEHIGDTARHAGGKVAARLADNHDNTAGHIFAAVVAHAFDNRDRAGIAHRETLARHTAEIAF